MSLHGLGIEAGTYLPAWNSLWNPLGEPVIASHIFLAKLFVYISTWLRLQRLQPLVPQTCWLQGPHWQCAGHGALACHIVARLSQYEISKPELWVLDPKDPSLTLVGGQHEGQNRMLVPLQGSCLHLTRWCQLAGRQRNSPSSMGSVLQEH